MRDRQRQQPNRAATVDQPGSERRAEARAERRQAGDEPGGREGTGGLAQEEDHGQPVDGERQAGDGCADDQ